MSVWKYHIYMSIGKRRLGRICHSYCRNPCLFKVAFLFNPCFTYQADYMTSLERRDYKLDLFTEITDI